MLERTPMRMDLYRWLRLALLGAGIALLGACGALPIARDRPAGHAAAPDRSTRLAKIVADSTPPGEHSGVPLMPQGDD